MNITRVSMLSGVKRTLDIPVTEEQLNNWNSGMLIQDVMSNLTDDQREFIISGITADEWDMFGDDDE
jgi:hypothetical protein